MDTHIHTHTPQISRPRNRVFGVVEGYVYRRNLPISVEKYQFCGCGCLSPQAVVSDECIPVDQFVEHLLPSLLSLASDPVPNVRVLLAKALRQTLLEKGMWTVFLNLQILRFTREQPDFLFRKSRACLLQTYYIN